MSPNENLTGKIKSKAAELGFFYTGISKAGFLETEAQRLETWLVKGMHGNMEYMQNNFDLRLDPGKLMPGAKSVISLGYNYFPGEEQNPDVPKIAKYAYGRDYHKSLRKKLKKLVEFIHNVAGETQCRICVDSAPILEKAWAKKSGIGWIGKNSNLINKNLGSFFFLAEIITDLELDYDGPVRDYCGTCTKCIDACPTSAISEPYVVDGSRCISYFTIELKDKIPEEFKNTYTDWIFGCDICQDVCPWNRFSKPNQEIEINPSILNFSKKDWMDITEEIYNSVFKGSPLRRAKFGGLMRNMDFVKSARRPKSEDGRKQG